MKKDMEKKETINQAVHLMKDSNEKCIEVQNHLRLNVDDQQDHIKHLKYQIIDDADDALKITATRSPMKKKEPVCV